MSAATLSRSSSRRSGLSLPLYLLQAARTTSEACAALLVTSSTYLCASPTGACGVLSASSSGFSCANTLRWKRVGSMNTSGTCLSAFTARVWLSETLTIRFWRAPAASSADAVRPIQPYSLPLFGAPVCQNEIDVKCENDGWS